MPVSLRFALAYALSATLAVVPIGLLGVRFTGLEPLVGTTLLPLVAGLVAARRARALRPGVRARAVRVLAVTFTASLACGIMMAVGLRVAAPPAAPEANLTLSMLAYGLLGGLAAPLLYPLSLPFAWLADVAASRAPAPAPDASPPSDPPTPPETP